MNNALKQTLSNSIKSYIEECMDYDSESPVDNKSTLSDLKFNSLDLVELLLHLEDKMNRDMPDIVFNPNLSIMILVDILESKLR